MTLAIGQRFGQQHLPFFFFWPLQFNCYKLTGRTNVSRLLSRSSSFKLWYRCLKLDSIFATLAARGCHNRRDALWQPQKPLTQCPLPSTLPHAASPTSPLADSSLRSFTSALFGISSMKFIAWPSERWVTAYLAGWLTNWLPGWLFACLAISIYVLFSCTRRKVCSPTLLINIQIT